MQNEPPAEIKALIDTALGAFNSKNAALYESAFGGEVVIIDGIAPYRWTGSNAQGRWFADAERSGHDLDVKNENIVYDSSIVAISKTLSSSHSLVAGRARPRSLTGFSKRCGASK
jgi:hypothetical protein